MTVLVRVFWVKIAAFLLVLMLVVTVGVATITTRNSQNTDKAQHAIGRVEVSVDHLEAFVDDLEDQSPSEQERNTAITRAVHLVPEIKQILCDAFPGATACNQSGG